MTEALSVINEEEQCQFPAAMGSPCPSTASKMGATKHPNGFPKNIERMFETFHQSPSGEFKPTFYNPFEIKHRRRTSKDQFSVLEASFMENSKPNATVRRSLAQRLGMTPRAVQVWFQNRRAKMKTGGGGSLLSINTNEAMTPSAQSPQLNAVGTTDESTNCSSLASPDHTGPPKKAAAKKGALGRRHSMPNMAPMLPVITNEHFKQLHEAIFGGPILGGQLAMQQSLNYQVPMKPIPSSQTYDQSQAYGYYPAATTGFPHGVMHSPQVQAKQRTPHHHHHYGNSMMGLEHGNIDVSNMEHNDLDYFLQSIIIPQGAPQPASSQQQQAFMNNLLQVDPSQINAFPENLASFLCAGTSVNTSNGHGEQQQNSDSYLLSKYMNDDRFAD